MKKLLMSFVAIAILGSLIYLSSCKKDETAGPTITLTGDNPLRLILNTAFTDPGATANDEKDGDLTSKITVDKSALDVNTVGSYSVTYSVSDEDGNSESATRTVEVYNQSENLAAIYDIHDVFDGDPSDYIDTITVHKNVNNSVLFARFANYRNAKVLAEITGGGTTVKVTSQDLTCGTDNVLRNFSGTGTINGSGVITINYSVKQGATTLTGVGTYTKKP